MKVSILCQVPSEGIAPHVREYEVPFSPADGYTVMDVLDYIARHLDPTLGYVSHSICDHGICGRCTVVVNGKPALACLALADADRIELAPRKGSVVRDLVVK